MREPGQIACFGEMLLRLAAPRGERLSETDELRAYVGGAEANVAIGLAHLGAPSAMITVLPDNPLGERALAELRRHAVDTAAVRRAAGRMGLYFLERGAGARAARVVYDREDSAFCRALNVEQPWATLLEGCAWLHVSGITAALAPAGGASVLAAVRAARELRLGVSFDCNYRPSLWQGRAAQAGELLAGIAAHAEVLFASEFDLALMLGRAVPAASDPDSYSSAARAALDHFAHLRQVACTFRLERGPDEQTLSAACVARDGVFRSRTHELRGIVERIGSGDAFAAGLLYGRRRGFDPQHAVEFAAAAASLKHSLSTDFNQATAEELEALLRGGSALVR
ncbi:MAG: sugar kinase [Steroidobacteraceae bacterium]